MMNYIGQLMIVFLSGLLLPNAAEALTRQPQQVSVAIPTQLSLRDSFLVNAYLDIPPIMRRDVRRRQRWCWTCAEPLLRRRDDGNTIITSRGVCVYRYDELGLLVKRTVNSSSIATLE